MEPPRDEAELLDRVRALEGLTLDELAARTLPGGAGSGAFGVGLHTKGKAGTLLETALGATGGSAATWDFPELEVELKTIPVDAKGKPKESTYVCTFAIADADRAVWSESWVRKKLARVLWVPLHEVGESGRRVGAARLWVPSAEEEAQLREDFDEIVGRIGALGIESVSAHVGVALQLRPKAANGSVKTVVRSTEGDLLETVPRGFYLRPTFTHRILRELPGRG